MATPIESGKSSPAADAPEAGTVAQARIRLGAPNAGTSKVVGNQAKKQEDSVTRHGTQKMK
jgi:hypothetical protein